MISTHEGTAYVMTESQLSGSSKWKRLSSIFNRE